MQFFSSILLSSELAHVRDMLSAWLSGSEGALSAPALTKLLRSAADALDDQEIDIRVTSLGGEVEFFKFHGATKVGCLRKAVEEATITAEAKGGLQRQRVRLVHNERVLDNDRETLSGAGFSFEQPAFVTTIVQRCSLEGILHHYLLEVEFEADKLDTLTALCGDLGSSETIVMCSNQYRVDCLIISMVRRKFPVWRIGGDEEAGEHVEVYSREKYSSSTKRVLIATGDDLHKVHDPEGVRVLINYDLNFGEEDEPAQSEDDFQKYIWQVGQLPGHQAVVINFATNSDDRIVEGIEREFHIKMKELTVGFVPELF